MHGAMCAAVALVMVMGATAAGAQESGGAAQGAATIAAQAVPPPLTPAAPPDVPKRYTVTVGADMATSYMFRGIHQESAGFVAQPPVDLGVSLSDAVTLNVGQWHSVHSGPTGSFYESDYYGSLTFTAGRLKPGVLFTSYTSPNRRFATVHEIAGFVSFDDSGSRFPLAPKATVAFELDGQADGGAKQGTYFELALRPGMKLFQTPLSVAVPLKLGLSLKDYYEGVAGSDTFGFFSTGGIVSMPITSGKLTWDLHGGVDVLWLGTNMRALNAGDRMKPVGIFGVTLVY